MSKVITYKAKLEDMTAEGHQLGQSNFVLKSDYDALQSENKELREALEFYTQPKIINGQGSGWQENIYDANNEYIISEEDFGHTARAVLNKYPKGGV